MHTSPANRDHEKDNNGVAVRYIVIGAIVVIWSGTWLFYLLAPELMSGWAFVAIATVLSGLIMTFAGYQYIQLNREADRAEVEDAKELAEHETEGDRSSAQGANSSEYEAYRVDKQLSS